MEGLRPLGQLDQDPAQGWKIWKQEFSLFAELTMADKEDKVKVKLFSYLIQGKGRKVSTTLTERTAQTLKTANVGIQCLL